MTKSTYRFVSLVVFSSIVSCAGGKKEPDAAQPKSLPSQVVAEGMDAPTLAADLARAEEEARKLADSRTIKEKEFSLIIDASAMSGVKQLNVDIVSTDAQNAVKIVDGGFSKYRDNRGSGASTIKHVFSNGGTVTLQVPTLVPSDSIVLWVDLPKPSEGDNRIMQIPLQLDRSTPGNPQAKPIRVTLTQKGWSR
jgi:hypothetical protein